MLTEKEGRIDVSVIIPVFKPTGALQQLCQSIILALPHKFTFEIILIDDSDSSASWSLVKSCAEKNDCITALKLSRNYGQHCAILAGIEYASGTFIITMDDDGQHDPAYIPKLLDSMNANYDVVYAYSPQLRQSRWRNAASIFSKALLEHWTGNRYLRNISAFRLFRKILLEGSTSKYGPNANIDVILSWTSSRFFAIEVVQRARSEGQSGYTFLSLMRHFSNLYVGYTIIPLRIVTFMGLSAFVTGTILMCIVLYSYFTSRNIVPGFAFMSVALTLFSGLQMISLGIIGEYIARIYMATSNRPTFNVREVIRSSHNAKYG